MESRQYIARSLYNIVYNMRYPIEEIVRTGTCHDPSHVLFDLGRCDAFIQALDLPNNNALLLVRNIYNAVKQESGGGHLLTLYEELREEVQI